MNPQSRVAVYYAPPCADPLWQRGADWLGRDPGTNTPRPQPKLDNIETITADARGYGFHCTVKPPMRLRPGTGWDELVGKAARIAEGIAAFDLPSLAVADLHGFLALRETAPSPEIQAASDAFVAGLDEFRAAPDDAELARRRRGRLSPEQDRNLVRWGYPYVFDTWFFHMTLTRRLAPAEHEYIRPAAEAFFADALNRRQRVTDMCLFTQSGPGAPFNLAARLPLHI